MDEKTEYTVWSSLWASDTATDKVREHSLEFEEVRVEKMHKELERRWNLKSSLLGSSPFEKSSGSTRSRCK
ncbi:hypothetical protein IPD43_15450 [Paenibacillus polymyxa]|uniref:hypothetical protein n=1 Tax=Paenibacillus polymyxa TaxID=1406 RepID=UPI00187D2276|nr:hypothetical protein [Paenibacillus polymyxa]MBE7899040.1 hypothetical protein [Paenibacillus polymyxa]